MKIREVIGRVINVWTPRLAQTTVDQTKTDYAFWDNFRRGLAKGYRIAGAFARPITQTLVSWVLMDGVEITHDDEYTQDIIKSDLAPGLNSLLPTLIDDLYGLGDQYVILNADGSLSVPSPETVAVEYTQLDYRRLSKVTVTTKLDVATITDEYRADGRTVRIKWKKTGNTETFEYANLIGEVPVIHFPNERSANETNGHPVYEPIRPIFSDYDDLITKMVQGAELMGNPMPTFEGLEDINATIEANSTEEPQEYQDEEGNTEERHLIRWDKLAVLFLGKGGSFKYSSPVAGFTNDIRNTLKSLFILILEYTRLPEVVWGTELSSSRSTSVEQIKTFHAYIDFRRLALEGMPAMGLLPAYGGLLALVRIWLLIRQLTDGKIQTEGFGLKWAALADQDEKMTLEWVKYLNGAGSMTDETALELSGRIEDPAAELEVARKEAAERQDAFENFINNDLSDEDPVLPEIEGEAA